MVAINPLLGDSPLLVEGTIEEVIEKINQVLSQSEVDALALLVNAVERLDPGNAVHGVPENYRRILVNLAKRFGEEVDDIGDLPFVLLGEEFTRKLLERAGIEVLEVPEYFLTYGNLEEEEE